MSINIRKRGWGKVFKSKKSIVSGIEKIWYYAFYYVSTVELNEATIKKYIQERVKHDIALDKLSVKEYADPFRDSGK